MRSPSAVSIEPRALFADARHALARGWALEGPLRLRCLRNYWNAVFRVDAGNERFLLRLHSPRYHAPSEIACELEWVSALARDTDLVVPSPIPSRDGELAPVIALPALQSRTTTLLSWIDGRRLSRFGPRAFARIGVIAATLHAHAMSWRPAADIARPRIDVESLGRYWFAPHDERGWRGLDRATRALFRRTLDHAARVERALEASHPHTFGLAHADLHRGNVLSTARGLAAIDFDDCGYASHLYDLAIPLAASSRGRASRVAAELLAGYRSVRAIDEGLVDHLDAFVAARAVAVALFVRGWSLEDARFRDRSDVATREAVAFVRTLAGV